MSSNSPRPNDRKASSLRHPRQPTTPPPWKKDDSFQKYEAQRKLVWGIHAYIFTIQDTARDTTRRIESIARDLHSPEESVIELMDELEDVSRNFREAVEDITVDFENDIREARSILDR